MRIVIITTEGEMKRDFVNSLTKETNGAVRCAIIQTRVRKPHIEKIKSFIRKNNLFNLLPEIIFWLKNKSPKSREVLSWLKQRTPSVSAFEGYLPPIQTTNNVNSDNIYRLLREIKPDIIAIWGGKIIKPHILETGKICLNIHGGLSPYYRGTNCNCHAILNGEIDKVGVTIHHAAREADAGAIITTIKANPEQSPKRLFKELNDKSMEQYKTVIKAFAEGKEMPASHQNLSLGKCYTLKNWSFKKEARLIKKLLDWDKRYLKMKLVAMLRIKNEMPIVEECLTKLSELVDEIVVVDNGSTDGTLEAYKKFPKIVEVAHTEGFHEGRDKILVHEMAKKRNPDWIIWIDADEIFENHLTRKEVEKYMNSKYNQVFFRMCNFWLDKERFRIDGHFLQYTLHPQRCMWRNLPETYFSNKQIHNGGIRGVSGPSYVSPYRLKHFGNKNMEEIKKKYELCTTVGLDAGRDLSHYQHIHPEVQGIRLIKFREFKNPVVNLFYISLFNQLANLIFFSIKALRKIKSLLGSKSDSRAN